MLFVSSGTDKSLCVPGNIVYLRYSNPIDMVLGGLHEAVLACQWVLASSGIDKPTRLPSNIVHLQYSSLVHLVPRGPC